MSRHLARDYFNSDPSFLPNRIHQGVSWDGGEENPSVLSPGEAITHRVLRAHTPHERHHALVFRNSVFDSEARQVTRGPHRDRLRPGSLPRGDSGSRNRSPPGSRCSPTSRPSCRTYQHVMQEGASSGRHHPAYYSASLLIELHDKNSLAPSSPSPLPSPSSQYRRQGPYGSFPT